MKNITSSPPHTQRQMKNEHATSNEQRTMSNEQVNTKFWNTWQMQFKVIVYIRNSSELEIAFFILAVVGSLLESAAEQESHFSNSRALFCRIQFVPTR